MIKIGDFARLSQVSVVTLRYYDEMDLLKPVKVDAFTGYRFYSAGQLPRLNRILALKDLGFFIADCAQSNYAQTQLSLASSLNFNYIDALSNRFVPGSDDRTGRRAQCR